MTNKVGPALLQEDYVVVGEAIPADDIAGEDLTKVDDTNVTLLFGGTPTGALLKGVSLTLGWTGTLAVVRGGTGLSTLTTGNFIRAASASAFEQRTPTQVRSDISAQAADATLTALAAADWVANSLPIGSGADTVAQVTFAANTFPGRSSSGNLVAKTITDFGFSILDDANAAAVLATLGVPTLAHGTYTPTLTGVVNVNASSPSSWQYLRVGNTVTVSGKLDVDATAAALTSIRATLPITSNFANDSQLAGAGQALTNGNAPVNCSADATNDQALMTFIATTTNNTTYHITFTYLVI